MILTTGSVALILDAAGTTVQRAFVALQDIDLDAIMASQPRLADLAGLLEPISVTYWLGWMSRHAFDWKVMYADRLTVEFTANRFRKFVVV